MKAKYRYSTRASGEILSWIFPCEIMQEYPRSFKIKLLTENGKLQVGKEELIVRKKNVF